MGRLYAILIGALLVSHGGAGLFIEGDHLLGLFNVDIVLDVIYLLAGIVLVVTGFRHTAGRALRGVLAVIGALFALLGVGGLVSNELFGLAPTGFTYLDIALFFVIGGLGLLCALLPGTAKPPVTAGRPIL